MPGSEGPFPNDVDHQMAASPTLQEMQPYVSPYEHIETVGTTIRTMAYEEFCYEWNVPYEKAYLVANLDGIGIPMHMVWDVVDVGDISRSLFEKTIGNCDCAFTVEEQMIDDIASELRQCIDQPQLRFGLGSEPIVYRVVPALALDRDMGAVVAYAMGQLVSHYPNDPKKSMLFKGCARDEEIQKILIQTMMQMLLSEMEE